MPRRQILCVEAASCNGSVARWEDALSQCLGRAAPDMRNQEDARCVPTGEQGFSGRIEYGELGDASLCSIVTSPHRFSHTMRDGASYLVPGLPLLLVTQVSGSSRFQHGERCDTLRPGDWCLLDTRCRFDWTAWTGGEQIVFTLERPRALDVHLLAERSIGHRWDSRTGLSRVLQGMMMQTLGQLDHLMPQSARALERSIKALAWDALQEQIERPSPLRYRDTESARVKVYIESRLGDQDLSIASIAQGCGMSVRSLHRVFADDPAGSVSKHLWQRRLSRCAAALRAEPQRSITDICLGWGFTNPAHFSRLFKAQYGVSPSDYRAIA